MRYGLPLLPRVTGAPYRRCYDAAVNGKIPAEFAHNRWTWDDSDLEEIIRGLGVKPTQPGNASEGVGNRPLRAPVETAA